MTRTAWVQFPPYPTHETCLLCSQAATSCLMKLACLFSTGQLEKFISIPRPYFAGENCLVLYPFQVVVSVPGFPALYLNSNHVPGCHRRLMEVAQLPYGVEPNESCSAAGEQHGGQILKQPRTTLRLGIVHNTAYGVRVHAVPLPRIVVICDPSQPISPPGSCAAAARSVTPVPVWLADRASDG
jgi:hypothetical protein